MRRIATYTKIYILFLVQSEKNIMIRNFITLIAYVTSSFLFLFFFNFYLLPIVHYIEIKRNNTFVRDSKQFQKYFSSPFNLFHLLFMYIQCIHSKHGK